jgi:murein DD-endopeptidase MepM/ murein hydrolase activator NlpD
LKRNLKLISITFSLILFVFAVSYLNTQNYGLVLSYNGKEIQESEIPATEFYVNDEFVFAGKNEETIQNILTNLKLRYADEDADCTFLEEVKLSSGLYSPLEIKDDCDIEDIILNGQTPTIEYEILVSDTLESICEKFEADLDEVKKNNNLKDDGNLEGINTLKINTKTKLLHVKSTKTEEMEIQFAHSCVEIEDAEKPVGYKEVSVEGENGIEINIDEVTYIDGNESNRTNISKKTIKEKIDKVIVVGTKKIEESKLIWPVPYTKNVSSQFGYRGNEFHSGIDISAPGIGGQDILACASGTVEYAGNDGSGYGKNIVISHPHKNKKFSTRYAHCKKLTVTTGSKVSAGQKIGEVGSTGNSTGNHLHLEVIEGNGHKKVNPKNYLSIP